DRQAEWENRYQSGQTGWDRGKVSPSLLAFLEQGHLRPCRIVVPGCGRGYEVALLAEQGFQVTAVDIAPSAVAAVRGLLAQHGLMATILRTDLLEWTPDSPFDAIYEQTSLCALPPETWENYADRLRQWLIPGGQLFALFMQTHRPGGPPFHCAIDDMQRLFPFSHWSWPETAPMRVEHPNGLYELGYRLRRNDTLEI
ncbi:MAG: methyltransferase domain-containing protein, partial [Magnetococcales bacterium]|nr:methyltransferase domain-containing protein [Magnetococcales bacterium]